VAPSLRYSQERYKSLEKDRNELLDSLENVRNSLSANEREVKEKMEEIKVLKGNNVDIRLSAEERGRELGKVQKLYDYNNKKMSKLKSIVHSSFSSNLSLSDKKMIRPFSEIYDRSLDDDNKVTGQTSFLRELENLNLLETNNSNGEYIFSELAHLLRKSIINIPDDTLEPPIINIKEGLKDYLGEVTIKKL
jgi:DNA polymerase II small subunit/DNA polymerase delta subunit B